MRFYGEIPKGFIQTGTEAFRNQAGYDSVMDTFGSKNGQNAAQRSKPAGKGWGLGLLALTGIVLTAASSLFANADSNPTKGAGQAPPEDGHGDSGE